QIRDINAALNGLTFQPTLHYNTIVNTPTQVIKPAEQLAITLNDLGNFGKMNTPKAPDVAGSVAITIQGKNNAPFNTFPATASPDEDVATVITGLAVGDVDDADDGVIGNEPMQVKLTVLHGTI